MNSSEQQIFTKLLKTFQEISKNAVPKDTARPFYMILESVSPLKFAMESDKNIKGYEDFLVVPKYRVFRADEIGKRFVFMSGENNQTFFYLYEPSSPQGSNGKPYKEKIIVEKCNLTGTCPDGAVTVTQGTIDIAIHERGLPD